MKVAGPRDASPLVWAGIRWLTRTIVCPYFGYRVRGLEHVPPGGALILANHQSFADPILLAVGIPRPVAFMARDSLFPVPVVGWILRSTGVIPIRRGAATSLREPIRRLQSGQLVGIFPEGTRTADGRVAEIKPGFVAMLRRAEVPIVCCGIAGMYEAWPRDRALPRPGRVRVCFGGSRTAEEVSAMTAKGREEEFADWVRSQLRELVREASEWRGR